MKLLKELQAAVILLQHIAKGGSGSGNFGHEGIPGQVGGSSSDGSGGTDKTPTGETTRTLERIRTNAGKAFGNVPVVATQSGVGLTVRGNRSTVENGMKALGLERDSIDRDRYYAPADKAGIAIRAVVNHTAGSNSNGIFNINISRTGTIKE